jgi:hypothetical protein
MDTFRMRLLYLFSPRCLFWLLLVGGGGFFLIHSFGESQVAGLHLNVPYLEPLEVFLKEQLSGRYMSIASGWVFSTIAVSWTVIGRQLKKAERYC